MIDFFLFISILYLYFIVYFDLKKNQIIYNVSYSENNKHHIKKNIQPHKKIPDISINKTTNFKDSNIIKTDKQTDNFKNEVKVDNEEEDDSSERLRYKLMNRDYQVVDNPLSAPERRVEEQQYPKVIKFNEKTRGEPDSFQLVGILYNKEINKNYQLFGRRIYPGAYNWEYYIRGKDAGGLDFKFPLNVNTELMDGQNINIDVDDNIFKIKIYNFDAPRYNPFI